MDWQFPSELDSKTFYPQEVFHAGLKLHHIANTAYPIGHLTTMRPYRVPRSAIQDIAPQAWQGVERLGLYVHVPFCQARCGYCEYTVVDPKTNLESEGPYFEWLCGEFDLWNRGIDTKSKTLIGFDIGGGTPSVAGVANIERLLAAARRNFILPPEIVISIETTPKIAAAEPQKIDAYQRMGIRRISMGVQTVNPRLLAQVGRDSTSMAYNRAAVENIRAAGFERFNVDVMYGFANQSLASLQTTLEHVISLDPEYITLYRMRYKGTRMSDRAALVGRDQIYAQAKLAKQQLLAAGYYGTTGKNTFSRVPGDVGTSDYLTERVIHGTPYLGLGLGAQSLSQVTLAYNAGAADKRLRHYRRMVEAGQLPIQDLYHLSRPAAMAKMIAVSFYFGEIDLEGFKNKFTITLEQAFPAEVDFLLAEGLMCYWEEARAGTMPDEGLTNRTGRRTLRLTDWGEQHVNGVIAQFYAGAVKGHLLEMAGIETLPQQFSVASQLPISTS